MIIVLVKLSWKSGNTKYTTFIYKMSKSNYLTINTTKIKQVELILRGAGGDGARRVVGIGGGVVVSLFFAETGV